ncbi:hypothetical protein AJ88_00725 [Mesorhizobium amorphae CCBAU 01583]|nr:hypothetical protein AJ88_00725 [Mesorhizobium amorphae CCBAU 01583]
MSLAVLPDLQMGAEDSLVVVSRLKDRFGKALRLAVAPDYRGNDRFRIEQAASMADMTGVPLMATNDVLYHSAERRSLQDVLTAIRLNTPVAEVGLELTANAERHLKPPLEMARLFRRHPQALAETLRFAGELSFSLVISNTITPTSRRNRVLGRRPSSNDWPGREPPRATRRASLLP